MPPVVFTYFDPGGVGVGLTKFHTGRLRPEVQPLTLLYSILAVKGTPFTAPFNNMQTLKFKGQLTNAFFATISQMFGSSSQLPTTTECAVIKSLCSVQTRKQCSAVVVAGRTRRSFD